MIATKILIALAVCVALPACNQENMCKKVSDQKSPLEFDLKLSVQIPNGSEDNFSEPKISNIKRQIYRHDGGFTSIYDIREDGNSKYTNVYGIIQSAKIYRMKEKKDRNTIYTYDPNPEINALGNRRNFSASYIIDADGNKSRLENSYKYLRDEHVNIGGCNIRTLLYDVEGKQNNGTFSSKAQWSYSPDLNANVKYELTSYNNGKIISKVTAVPTGMTANFTKAPEP